MSLLEKLRRIKNSQFLKTHGLTVATFTGVVIGVGLGLLLRLREDPWSKREVN
jgi:hypothetical protein